MSQFDQLQPESGGENRDSSARILSPELKQQFDTLRSLLQRALWLAERCADVEATQILRSRLTNLQAAALLVVVGEVKAGKSSFINALLREDVCEVAPGPCTVRIQELLYGAERKVETLGDSWQRVSLPKEVLREITMVDTPGTNSIVKDHQTITEKYIPQSDLVVFVFSAVNPHTKSAWELLTLIKKEWHRKVVFVLQQSDRASQRELTTNLEHVRQYAHERQVENPPVFILSAKREMEGIPENAFVEFRNFLQNTIACGRICARKKSRSMTSEPFIKGCFRRSMPASKKQRASSCSSWINSPRLTTRSPGNQRTSSRAGSALGVWCAARFPSSAIRIRTRGCMI